MAVDFSHLGRALAAPARSAMLDLLIDGSSRRAAELAAVAEVGAPTASGHLRMLVEVGLILVEPHGRQRRYRLAGPEVASALEELGRLCPITEVGSFRRSREQRDLGRARLCYDHLAGRLGVAMADAFVGQEWLREGELSLTDSGRYAFVTLGVDVAALAAGRRPLSRPCADWTERRPHLAGTLGARMATLALDDGWVSRRPTGRGLDITDRGRRTLSETWGVDPRRLSGDRD